MPSDAPVVEAHASVSGELSDLLIELASGLRRACVYGPRHNTVLEAATSFVARSSSRRRDRGTLAIAAAGSHLIVEVRPAVELMRRLSGVTTGLEHPLLGALADRLNKHEVGEIVLAEGVTPKEIAAVLGFLSTDPDQTGRALGREDEEALRSLPSIRIHRSAISAEVGSASASEDPDAENDAELWAGLARAALGIPESEEVQPHSPAEVATALAARAANPKFNRRITPHLLAISKRLGVANPLESAALARRLSEVFRRLDSDTLGALLSMSGDPNLQRDFLRDATTALDVDVVLGLIQAAAETNASDISRWMLRLLSKLARHAGTESGPVAHRSESGLREQIRALLSGWNLENPNPEEYEEALAGMSSATRSARDGSGSVRSGVGAKRVLQTALEVEEGGPVVRCAVDDMVSNRQIPDIVDLLQRAPDGTLPAEIWARLVDRPVLYRLIEEDEPDWDVLDLVLPHAGLDAVEPLLDRLASADSRSDRRRLFDLIRLLGPEVGEPAVRCLGQPDTTPWYVLRNVLSLLAVLDVWPESFDPWYLTSHENSQVRLEAVRLCLRMPALRDKAILRALEDQNSRVVAMGIAEAERGCPADAEERLVGIARSAEGEFVEFRTHCIRALTDLGSPGALEALLEIASPRRKGLRRQCLDESPELLAALRGLVQVWPEDERARQSLVAARASDRPAIVEAAS
ncbi:MAG: hypothetical protein WBO43_16560 [Gemmatimonadota bacterium]